MKDKYRVTSKVILVSHFVVYVALIIAALVLDKIGAAP